MINRVPVYSERLLLRLSRTSAIEQPGSHDRVANAIPTIRQHTRSAQDRARSLPDSEKEKLSIEARELALEQYDMASEAAKGAGKDVSFAHQVGVLRAAIAVIVLGEQVDRHRESELQMETVPFNKLPPKEGRQAIAEYLVYKFFPDKADESLFSPALVSFKHEMLVESKKTNDPSSFMNTMIYACKCDWQRYIANMPS